MTKARRATRHVVWLFLGLPFGWLVYSWATGTLFYGELLHQSGLLSARLLILTMAVTPLRLLWPHARWTLFLQRQRRYFGVAAFAYAALHTIVYIDRKQSLSLMWEEGLQPSLLTGWMAFAVFSLLAATSNDAAVRLLKSAWKKLHRLVYPAALLLFAHWLLTAYDLLPGTVHLLLLGLLETVRVIMQSRTHGSGHST